MKLFYLNVGTYNQLVPLVVINVIRKKHFIYQTYKGFRVINY